MTVREIKYLSFTCDGCGVIADIRPSNARPDGWVEYQERHFHSTRCWFSALSSTRVLVQGRGTLDFSEAAEEFLR